MARVQFSTVVMVLLLNTTSRPTLGTTNAYANGNRRSKEAGLWSTAVWNSWSFNSTTSPIWLHGLMLKDRDKFTQHPKVPNHLHQSPSLNMNPRYFHPPPIFLTYFLYLQLSINLQSTSQSSEWVLSKRFPHQNSPCFFLHPSYIPQSIIASFISLS
jgi:hypothetical protein